MKITVLIPTFNCESTIERTLNSVKWADQILVIERGKICERGSHNELMIKNGRYRELCKKQIIRELDES